MNTAKKKSGTSGQDLELERALQGRRDPSAAEQSRQLASGFGRNPNAELARQLDQQAKATRGPRNQSEAARQRKLAAAYDSPADRNRLEEARRRSPATELERSRSSQSGGSAGRNRAEAARSRKRKRKLAPTGSHVV